MLARIIRDFIGVPSAAPDEAQMDIDQQTVDKFENRSTFIQYIEAEYGLREAVLSNFKHYMLKARHELRLKAIAEPNADLKAFSDKVLTERFSHSDQLSERLEFLKYLGQNSQVGMTKEQLSVLWDELVTMQMFQADSDLFFRFLKDICDLHSQGHSIVHMEDLVAFFREQILDERSIENVFQRITLEGYQCI